MNGFVIKAYNNVPIIIDRYPENSCTRVLAIDAVRHPNGPRCKSLDHIWLSQLTPSEIATHREKFEWYFENVMKERLEAAKEYLSNLKADFIPKVENPDPAQLERLKDSTGDLKEVLRKTIEEVEK